MDVSMAVGMLKRIPTDRVVPLWAVSGLGYPVNLELLPTIGALHFILPAGALTHRPHQPDSSLGLTAHHEISSNVARIRQMKAWGTALIDQRLLNSLGALGFCHVGWSRLDVGNQMNRVRLAGLTEMDCVARPFQALLVAIARLSIIGAFNLRWKLGQFRLGRQPYRAR